MSEWFTPGHRPASAESFAVLPPLLAPDITAKMRVLFDTDRREGPVVARNNGGICVGMVDLPGPDAPAAGMLVASVLATNVKRMLLSSHYHTPFVGWDADIPRSASAPDTASCCLTGLCYQYSVEPEAIHLVDLAAGRRVCSYPATPAPTESREAWDGRDWVITALDLLGRVGADQDPFSRDPAGEYARLAGQCFRKHTVNAAVGLALSQTAAFDVGLGS
ncbi:MAG TPA: hypothetical protein VLH84_01075 [Patescibacteria group bacterium]|nr:hypothetical protein [Patescibacteria group bacterium]